MKRLLTLFLCLSALYLTAIADSAYSVYSVKGRVEINAGGWHDARKHENLSPDAEVKIYKGGMMVVVDRNNGMTIKCDRPTSGRVLLRDLIREANSSRSSSLFTLIRELFGSGSSPEVGFRAIGGVTLGPSASLEKDIADMLKTYAFTRKEKKSAYVNPELQLSKARRSDKCFTFRISNYTTDSLYIGLMAYDRIKRTYSSPLDVVISNASKTSDGLFIRLFPGQELELDKLGPDWIFAACEGVEYRVFASTSYFEIHSVVELLNNRSQTYLDSGSLPSTIFLGINK